MCFLPRQIIIEADRPVVLRVVTSASEGYVVFMILSPNITGQSTHEVIVKRWRPTMRRIRGR